MRAASLLQGEQLAQPALGCVGRVVPLVQKPKSVVDAPGASVATHAGSVTSTTSAVRLTVPFHDVVIATAGARRKRSTRGCFAVVAAFRTVIPAQ